MRQFRRQVLGPEHPETLDAMQMLANAYLQAGRVADATDLLAEASTRTPENTFLAMRVAALQVWFAKEADHAATRQRMLKWASDTRNPNDAERVAKLACLRPIDDGPNRIKEQQLGLFAGRTSCHAWWPNQLRLLVSTLAHVVVEGLRRLALRGTEWAQRQATTLRASLLKIGAVVTRNTRRLCWPRHLKKRREYPGLCP